MERTGLKRLAGVLLILCAAGIPYLHTLAFGFVFDDHVQIEQNPWLRDPAALRHWLTQPFWGFDPARGSTPSNYYRPLFGGLYWLVAGAWGARPAPFHAVSLALHAAVSLLVALGARRLGASNGGALIAGTLFAVHPVHVESVSWVAAQVDPLCAVFSILAILAALAAGRDAAPVWAAPLSSIAFLLACLTKETGVALVIVLLAVEVPAPRGRRFQRLGPLLLALAAYLALRNHALGGLAPRDYHVAPSLLASSSLALALLGRYLPLLIVPFPAHIFASVGVPSSLATLPVLLGATLAAAAALALLRARRSPPVLVALATLLAFLIPPLLANRIGAVNFAERYLYLPSVGFAWLVALGIDALPLRPGGAARRAAAGLAALGLVALAGLSRSRSTAYRDDRAYFEAAVRSSPTSPIAHNNLGAALAAARDWDGAAREHAAALDLDAGDADAWANLGAAREHQGDLAGALEAYREAQRRQPLHAVAGLNLSRLHVRAGDERAAADDLDRLLAGGLSTADVLLDRAYLHLKAGDVPSALTLLAQATALFPERPRGFYLLAHARYASGELQAAEAAARTAVERGGGAGPRRLLALLHWRRGDLNGARAELRDALRVAPGDPPTLQLLARLDAGNGNAPGAIIPDPVGADAPGRPGSKEVRE